MESGDCLRSRKPGEGLALPREGDLGGSAGSGGQARGFAGRL